MHSQNKLFTSLFGSKNGGQKFSKKHHLSFWSKLKLYFINLPINQKKNKAVIKTGRPVAKETTELILKCKIVWNDCKRRLVWADNKLLCFSVIFQW